MRRAGDIIVAVLGLALLILPAMLIALAIFLSMGRPILFRQQRAGLMAKSFELIKFRSMTHQVGPSGEMLPDAERTTALGHFLRRSRLDELPELWNIVRGDMSLVGPRPLLPETIAGFGRSGLLRSMVRPGLTGLAQVSGNTLLDNQQKLAVDLLYVRERSATLDLYIIWRTPLVMIRGEHIDPILMEKAHASYSGRGG